MYIFYYYWTHDLRPAPAKGRLVSNHIIGSGDVKISQHKWRITQDQFYNLTLRELTLLHPWPDTEDKP